VDCDNVGGAQLAAERLLSADRKRVATIAGPQDMTAAIDRLTGYRQALTAAGRKQDRVAHGDFSRESGQHAMTELLTRHPDLDAVFAANDMMAAGAMRVLRAAGRTVPDDVSVVGFDDIELARHTEPPLTTIHQPIVAQARTMTELLLTQIGGDPVAGPVVLPTELVERESV
jgi:DNA-binding LacI/PurR family transcriptional regulator